MNQFSQLNRTRQTTRDFNETEIPAEILAAIFEDARWAPSWSNTRPYQIALASGDQAQQLRAAYLREFDAFQLRKRRIQNQISTAITIFSRLIQMIFARAKSR